MKKLVTIGCVLSFISCGKSDENNNVSEKESVKNAAAFMFENYYVHEKGLDGAALIRQIDTHVSDEIFYDQIQNVFYKHNDGHTVFKKPKPFQCNGYGVLPENLSFEIAMEKGIKKLVISKVAPDYLQINNQDYINAIKQFRVGDIVLSINGVEALQAVKNVAPITFGSNADAQETNGLDSLLFRSAALHRVPQESQYQIVIERDGKVISIPSYKFTFKVCSDSLKSLEYTEKNEKKINNIDYKIFYMPNKFEANNINNYLPVSNELTDVNGKKYVYVKLPSFTNNKENIKNSDINEFVNSMLDKIKTFLNKKYDGVLLDVRDNIGGYAPYADKLVQFFYDPSSTNKLFYPMEFRMKATQGNIELLNKYETILNKDGFDIDSIFFKNMKNDVSNALKKGDIYTTPRQMTSQDELNAADKNIFTKSSGKTVIILTNANCYSACDLFVARMKDQDLTTKIVGETKYTGGGGGNTIKWSSLQEQNFTNHKLPKSAEMKFSWMQMQSRTKTGEYRTIEGNGTTVDCVIPKTVAEIQNNGNDASKNMSYVKRVLENIDNNNICEN
jgi:C-terminal processing protease CtpA/Prc